MQKLCKTLQKTIMIYSPHIHILQMIITTIYTKPKLHTTNNKAQDRNIKYVELSHLSYSISHKMGM